MELINDQYYIKTYVPKIYIRDIIKEDGKETKNLAGQTKNEIYRFYGLFSIETDEMIGSIKYYVKYNDESFSIEALDIDKSCRRQKYGSILMNETLKDILSDFPHLKRITVCSLPWSIPFYEYNDFTVYLGDNCLEKILVKKD